MILSLNEVVNFKNEIAERFSVQIHFHDGCGGQYFTIEEPTTELKEYITAYFAGLNMNVLFSDKCEHFSVGEVM